MGDPKNRTTKAKRLKIFTKSTNRVRGALLILQNIDHPDDDPRAMEEAVRRIEEAIGKSHLSNEPDGFDDLCQWYFS